METVREAANNTLESVDKGIDNASDAVRNAAAVATAEAQKAYQIAQDYVEVGKAHSQATEEQLFSYLKEGVAYCTDHPEISLTALAATTAIVLPGPRRFLWRSLVNRFQSEESRYKSAEMRLARISDSTTYLLGEANKLQQRLQPALTEYQSGLHKLQATSKLMRNLSPLLEDLRLLPRKQALALRAEAATKAAAARRQQQAIDRQVYDLLKKGIS